MFKKSHPWALFLADFLLGSFLPSAAAAASSFFLSLLAAAGDSDFLLSTCLELILVYGDTTDYEIK